MAFDYNYFLRKAYIAVTDLGVDPRDTLEDINVKRKIIKESGYSSLKGKGGIDIPINKVKDSRIGKVYRNLYNKAEAVCAQVPIVRSEDGTPLSELEEEIAEEVFIAVELAGAGDHSPQYFLPEARKLYKYAISHTSQ